MVNAVKKPVCCCCRLMNWLISFGVLAIGAVGLWLFLGQPSLDEIKDLGINIGDYLGNITDFDFGDFTNVLDDLPDNLDTLFDNDPFQEGGAGGVGGDSMAGSAWPTKGEGGLTLQLQNALDDAWQGEFLMAVSDWENGTPDALTLSTKDVAVDHSCKAVNGVMKVCNGNYGETGWLGINEILQNTVNKEIQSSVAKMNEYYLLNGDRYERQFTMCHEIGHGFGLGHTDENFYNSDLGNCLDYTRTPKNNLHPDETNYEQLASMYGVVSDRRRSLRPSFAKTEFSEDFMEQYDLALEELAQEISTKQYTISNSNWRLLRKHSAGSHFIRELNEDYTLEVQMLHPIKYDDEK
mmetsp:Transcript_1302/g.1683  ORF Transcript_1302/g.1683 Transcript_1302/m.1683 type:complete len:351 (+) Transcript_1302:135-1187(+)